VARRQHDIEKYLKGELTDAERNALERKALDDPFLMDALEGAEQISAHDFSSDLNNLHAALQERVKQKGSVIPLWLWPARIAAGLALLAISTFVVMKLMQPDPNADLAVKEDSIPPVVDQPSAAPVDTAKSTPAETLALSEQEPTVRKSSAASVEAKSRVTTEEQTGPDQKPVYVEQPMAAAEIVDQDKNHELNEQTEQVAGVRTDSVNGYVNIPANERAELAQADTRAKKMDSRVAGVEVEQRDLDAEKESQRLVSGRVTDERGEGIPGVNVFIKGTEVGTVTDASGNYQIRVNNPEASLVFSFIGMQTVEEGVSEQSVMDVSLDQDVSQLSEVVVVGYGAEGVEKEEEIPTMELAVPAGGRAAYKQYLEKNLRYPERALENNIEGRVTVQFTVDPSGKMRDFNVLKGLGFGCDEEVIRLIKQGPVWTPTKKNDEPVTDKVKVRMRFRLPKKK